MISDPGTILASLDRLRADLDRTVQDLRATADRLPAPSDLPIEAVGVRFPFDDAPGHPQITLASDWQERVSPDELGACVTQAIASARAPLTPAPEPPDLSPTLDPRDIHDVDDLMRRTNATAAGSFHTIRHLADGLGTRGVTAPDDLAPDGASGTSPTGARPVSLTVLGGRVVGVHIRGDWASGRSGPTVATAVNDLVVCDLESTPMDARQCVDWTDADPWGTARVIGEHL